MNINHRRKKRKRQRSKFYLGFLALILLGFLVYGINHYKIHKIDGTSMTPTLTSGERVLVKKNIPISRYQIIAFSKVGEEGLLVKRVVGMPGDSFIVQQNELILDLSQQATFRTTYRIHLDSKTAKQLRMMTKVPKAQYLVLGDNLEVSKDSRSFGFIQEDAIEGVLVTHLGPMQSKEESK
ncbi:signal peptidase I [Enterococcus sp. DIV0187]|uniref:signal peptidase I n=1 Tax=Enterococcus sp. DIV0187 TaxID=2774644 RepID=UPI003F68395F